MILPRVLIPKRTMAGRYRIESAFTASYRPTAIKVMGVFMTQSTAVRRRNARRAVAVRMGAAFVKRLEGK